MTDLDIETVERNFRTFPEVVAVCQLAKEQREVITARSEHIKWLDGHSCLMGDAEQMLQSITREKIIESIYAIYANCFDGMRGGSVTMPIDRLVEEVVDAVVYALEDEQAGERS